ncbi:hypothetical protein TNCV_1134991 [Trichonephila clavipes]|nr:hypothetical protein TNCV_1134991 [Trichonephila clavipes]
MPRKSKVCPNVLQFVFTRIRMEYFCGTLSNISSSCGENGLQQAEVGVDFSPTHPRPMEIPCVILTA